MSQNNYKKREKEEIISKFRYVVKRVKYLQDERYVERPVIVLKEKDTGITIAVTEYADYVLYRKNMGEDVYAWVHSERACYSIVGLLNYVLIDNYSKYRIGDIADITKQMAQDYLYYYCAQKNKAGFYRTRDSCEKERQAIGTFLYNLCYEREHNTDLKKMSHLRSNEILTREVYTDGVIRKNIDRWLLQIRIWNDETGYQQLIRDMPEEMASRIVAMAEVFDPELTFPIVLGLYMGLREGEVCNVRKRDSEYGPGILIDYDGVECRMFKVNLKKEYKLRSDGKSVGKIKRKNERIAFHKFNNTIYSFYRRHLRLIEDKEQEEYGAIFLNKNMSRKTGKYSAMTVSSYRKRIEKLIQNYVIPSLKNDPNPEIRAFYYQIISHTWGAHALRHWFTVELVLEGCDDVEIMGYRGDKVNNTAQQYLMNKGAINKKYKEAATVMGRMIKDGEKELHKSQ